MIKTKIPQAFYQRAIDQADISKDIMRTARLPMEQILAKSMQKKFAFVAFQDMFPMSLDDTYNFMTSPYNRIATSIQTRLEKYRPQISKNGLLNNLPSREGNLNFLLERYARQNPIDLQDRTQPFTQENFYKNVSKIDELKLQVVGSTKVNRALIGFNNVGKIFDNDTPGSRYASSKLPPLEIKNSNYNFTMVGIIQTLNGLVCQSIDIRKNFGNAIPESITSTCFELPNSLAQSDYNPLDNKILNLGKNLFDFDGGIVSAGSLDIEDVRKWQDAMRMFSNTQKEVNIDLWEYGKYYTPTDKQIASTTPKIEKAWALSQHFLYQSPSIDINNLNNSENSANVCYALYTDNHITRPLETSILAENKNGDVCTTFYPYVKTYENPSMLVWMTIDDISRMIDSLNQKTTFQETTKNKIIQATILHRYINQSTFPVASSATLEKIVDLDAADIKTNLIEIESGNTSDQDTTYGGNYAANIFEKNFKILSESGNNVRLDAVNLVADDNAKFMDVRLPPMFYSSRSPSGQTLLKDYPIDYALAYSTNSNVVLIAKSQKDSIGFADIGIQNGCSSTNTNKLNLFWNELNNNKNFQVSNGDGQAKNVKIERRVPITPKRMLLDTYYILTLDWLYKYNKIRRDFGSSREWDKIDSLSRPYRSKILSSGLLNPDNSSVFYTEYNKASNKMFINILRGVLYDSKTLKQEAENSFKQEKSSRDFLTSIPSSNMKSSDMLVDSVFYVNQSTFKPFTERIGNLPPIDSKVDDAFTFRGVLPSLSAYHHEERQNLPPTANLDATIPFLANGITTLNQINSLQKNEVANRPLSMGGDSYARCFDPINEKSKTLETLYYYHTAALNNGAPFGTIDQGNTQGKTFFKDTRSFVINPYSCENVETTLALNYIGDGLNTVRCYETRTMLRKEYYANRFMALFGFCISRIIENNNIQIPLITKDGETSINVYYEAVLGSIARLFLDTFSTYSNLDSFRHFERILNDVQKNTLESIGNNFIKMCFFETTPFEKIITNRWPSYNFVYANSKTRDIAMCLASGFPEKELDTKNAARLLEYIVDTQGYRPVYSNAITQEQVEKAYRFICSLDEKGLAVLKEEYRKYEMASSIAATALAVPAYELPQEFKDFLCSQGKKQIPMLPSENSMTLINYLAKQYADAGIDLEEKIKRMACDTVFVEDEVVSQPVISTGDKRGVDRSKLPKLVRFDSTPKTQEDTSLPEPMLTNIKADQSPPAGNKVMYAAVGLFGLATLSYAIYNFKKTKKKKR